MPALFLDSSALHLAAAVVVADATTPATGEPVVLVTSDADLIAAAPKCGLRVEDPRSYAVAGE